MVSRRRPVRPRIASEWPHWVSRSSGVMPIGIRGRRRRRSEDQSMESGNRVEPASIQCRTDGPGPLVSIVYIDYDADRILP